MTRRTAATNEDPQSDASPAIPPGTQADVTVKYRTRVDPNQTRSERDELADLVDLANETEEPPLDEVSAFCQRWVNFAGQTLSVIRLPDPPERRLAGNSYAHPCFNLERLGDTTFDPDNLISTLQFINRNSGGVFRIWLSYQGAPVPEARLDRLAIGDPPGSHDSKAPVPLVQNAPAAPMPLPPQKSESERQLEQVKDQLFMKALERALNPPVPTATNGAVPLLPPDQQATLFLLGNTDFMPNMFKQLTALAQQTAGVDKEPTIKERALDAATEILKSNPRIIDRVTDVADRIIGRIFGPDPRYDGQVFAPQQQFSPTPSIPYPPTAAAPSQFNPGDFDPGLPEAPVPDDDSSADDDVMDIIESLTTLLNSATPLDASNPPALLRKLETKYPVKFRLAIRSICAYSVDDLVDWISDTGGPVYASMLNGPASGPYLRQRISELQQMVKDIIKAKQNAQSTATTAPEATATPVTTAEK